MEFKRISFPDQHYLYVEKHVPMEGTAISQAMGAGFGELFGFTQAMKIDRLSMPSAIYQDMPSAEGMVFRAAIFVKPSDADKAEGNIKAGKIPAGEAITTTHVGGYANLNETHQKIWAYMAEENIPGDMPIWEIYIDDPTTVPEDTCRTDVFRKIGE